jgi:phosphohistidine phosphatase
MKELIILRHAKSNSEYLVDDIDRPLSTSGIERIARISKKMHFIFKNADIIISSPANRALHTAQLMMRELDYNYDKLIVDRKLYTFYVNDLIDYVLRLDNQWNKVIFVGHNPAFTELVNHFSQEKIIHLRTAGLAKITFESDDWVSLLQGEMVLGQKPITNIH